jgi:excinuclease UvrABC ATPase subunit
MGPEAGNGGGKVVAAGPPAAVIAKAATSHTGALCSRISWRNARASY